MPLLRYHHQEVCIANDEEGTITTATATTTTSPQPHQQQLLLPNYGSVVSSNHLLFPNTNNNANATIKEFDDEDDEDHEDDQEWSGYYSLYAQSDYDLPVDVHRGYRATQLHFCSWHRPHMRAFHASWMLYFCNFLLQFSMAPLMVPMCESLQLTKAQVWNTNLWMMVGGIPMRFLLGPLCDQYGARTIMTYVCAACAIPGLFSFAIVNLTTLTVMKIMLGAMDTFVPGQYWITCHFVRDAVGSTAMAISGGLGASGGAVAQVLLGSCLYPLLLYWTNDDVNVAWRITLMIPSVMTIVVAYFFYYHSDDTPLGNLSQLPGLLLERESNNHPNTTTAVDSFRRGMINLNSWILCWQYATCCGVDFTMCNGTALYYHAQHPDWSVASTAAVAGLYSMAALYARGVGGWLSDTAAVANMKWGRSDDGHTSESMRGRLWAQCLCLLLQGICNILLARTDAAFMNLAMLVVFSIFVQMSMGTCFGIVPYVDGLYTGSVAGVVGAGGNVGAALFALVFMHFDYRTAMQIMGCCTMAAAMSTPLIAIKGYASLFGSSGTNHDDDDDATVMMKPTRTLFLQARSPHFTTLRQHHHHANAAAAANNSRV